MNRLALSFASSLAFLVLLGGCLGSPADDPAPSDEPTGEADLALSCTTADAYDALVHYTPGSPSGTYFRSYSALPTDSYSTCTDRYVVDVDGLYDDFVGEIRAGYAGPVPTNAIACAATTITADAQGHGVGNGWGWVISTDQTAHGLWFNNLCFLPNVLLGSLGEYSLYDKITIRVKAYTSYRGVVTPQRAWAGVRQD